jgi:hypothetical protein
MLLSFKPVFVNTHLILHLCILECILFLTSFPVNTWLHSIVLYVYSIGVSFKSLFGIRISLLTFNDCPLAA